MLKIPKLIASCFYRAFFKKKYDSTYLVEPVDWSIRQDGILISKSLSKSGLSISFDSYLYCHRSAIVHFGSSNLFNERSVGLVRRKTKIVATFFHGNFGIDESMDRRIKLFLQRQDKIDVLVVSNTIMYRRFVDWGFSKSKIKLIPLGVDLQLFRHTKEPSFDFFMRHNISRKKLIIGSFQKDGEGWNEGNIPKTIKGPELLVDSLRLIAKRFNIHVLLTGPSRGYVKNNLRKHNISYTHVYLDDYESIVDYYKVLDCYLITSSEEGGPKAVLESLAMGIPLISTRVGMSVDVIKHKENGVLVENKAESVVQGVEFLISNQRLRDQMIVNGLNTVKQYEISNISKEYVKLYKGLLP